MKDLLNKLMMYHQIQQMSRNGWRVSRIAAFLRINRRTVSKYLDMTEEEFLPVILTPSPVILTPFCLRGENKSGAGR